jgi:hypothetical protein
VNAEFEAILTRAVQKNCTKRALADAGLGPETKPPCDPLGRTAFGKPVID